MKESPRRIKHDCYFFCILVVSILLSFRISLFWLVFLFANYCYLHNFLKKNHEVLMLRTFTTQVMCFTTSITIIVLVWLARNRFACKAIFPAKSFFLRILFLSKSGFPVKPTFLSIRFLCVASFLAEPVSLLSQFPC